MKVLELFSGYGTASFALKQLGIPYELIAYSDIDKYANQCFKQNHCPDDEKDELRLGDITNINPNDLEDFDLLTGGFPCQSFSMAGKGLGELDPRGTLFYEIIRIAEVKKPKYMLLENVKGLVAKRFKSTFDKIISELERIGYNVYWKVLNTKEFGIPQNRERIWFVCFRKDIDVPLKFQFPEPIDLKLFIKDILEKEVDKKYYLTLSGEGRNCGNNQAIEICPTLTGELSHSYGRVFTPEKLTRITGEFRRLTPKECFRLQGFLNDEVNLDGLSDTQCYKLAGNGQSVNVVNLIFKNMFKEEE